MASDLRKLLLSWTGTIKLLSHFTFHRRWQSSVPKRHLCNLSVKGVVPDKGGVFLFILMSLCSGNYNNAINSCWSPSFESVAVEHSLSHIGRWQETKLTLALARTLFTAVVHNLHVLAKMFTNTTEESATQS